MLYIYIYINSLQLRNTAKALSKICFTRVDTTPIRNWIQKYKPQKIVLQANITEFIIDETSTKG